MPATIELLQKGRYRISQTPAQQTDETYFEAFDTVRDADVIVQEVPERFSRVSEPVTGRTVRALSDQVKTLIEIKHESLVHVKDFFTEAGRQYLVTESVEGDNLADLLARNKTAFHLSDVLDWADQLLDALNYLHTAAPPIVHGSVAPRNIILRSNGQIKLCGIALTDPDGCRFNLSTSSAEAGLEDIRYSPIEQIWEGLDPASQKVIVNSLDERSERILKEPADPRSDVYSLGATLYYLLTAREPVDALERSIDLIDGKPDPLKEPAKLDPRIPAEVSEVLMKATEVKRQNRFDSAAIMRQVLKTALVRAKEREAAEAHEEEEAAETIKLAQQFGGAQVRKLLEQERRELESERQRRQEQSKDPSESAVGAQQYVDERTTDAQRISRQNEPTNASAASDGLELDRLLDIDLTSGADRGPGGEQATSAFPNDEPVLSIDPVEAIIESARREVNERLTQPVDDTAALDSLTEESETKTAFQNPPAPDYDLDLGNSSPRFGFGLKVAAAGAVIVVAAIAGVFVVISGSSDGVTDRRQLQQSQKQTIPTENPAPAPVTEVPPPSFESTVANTVPQTSPEDPAAPRSGRTVQARRRSAAKSRATGKKQVTVDDLINDN